MVLGVWVYCADAANETELQRRGSSAHPCPCAVATFSDSDRGHRLAAAFISRRTGVSGVHVEADASVLVHSLEPLSSCLAVSDLRTTAFEDVAQLKNELTSSFSVPGARKQHTCVAWLVSVDTVLGVADALKELLEANTLRGEPVVPRGGRGMLILVSQWNREELKERLPHRVVHMLSTVDVQ